MQQRAHYTISGLTSREAASLMWLLSVQSQFCSLRIHSHKRWRSSTLCGPHGPAGNPSRGLQAPSQLSSSLSGIQAQEVSSPQVPTKGRPTSIKLAVPRDTTSQVNGLARQSAGRHRISCQVT